ncbi:beta-alanine-activating enzyme-like [Mercenaria mercenaria]|uniref:beta-alanine-activating enzyme-like n=1 Tax=Mercenaria mercenaria TaxID=6596 RepID=UPI00234E581B|nr:beta-alanine-activating enzyme-like [Mercenaria mercenaria]
MADGGLMLLGLVEEAYSKHADRQAVLYDNGDHQSSISYKQLWSISIQVKKLFTGREKEVVGLCLKIDHRMPAILLGVLGCKAVFYNFDVKGFVYAMQVLKDVGAQVVLIHQDFIQAVQHCIEAEEGVSTGLTVPGLEDYFLVQFTSVVRKKHVNSLAYCITTSGTTGKPKVVMVPNECVVPNILHLRELFSLMSDDLVLAATALTFDPSIVEIFMALSVGACLLIVPPAVKMMPDRLLEMIHGRNKVTVIQVTPTLMSRFNASKSSQTILGDNSVMRVVALGGEKFPSCSWLQSIKSPSNKTCFYNLYGTTEVSCWATYCEVTEGDLRRSAEISLGHPLQGTVVEVCDDTGNIVTEGQGRLWMGGKSRQCIIDASEELNFDKLVLRDTGDDVRVEGNSLYYIGRRDEQKKRNGRRINLEEIKMVGRRKVNVHDCEVMLIGDQLIMFVILSQRTANTDMVSVYMKENLPSHWWPDSVILIANLPVTEHGKVDMNALENIYQERLCNYGRTNAIEYLMSVWKELTNRAASIPEAQNFILAGGDSLKAVRLANTIENILNVQLPQLVDIVLHQTFSDVRKYLISIVGQGSEQVDKEKSEGLKDDQIVTDEFNKGKSINNFEIERNTSSTLDDCNQKLITTKEKIMYKRKLGEDQTSKQLTKVLNDTQFTVSRCNRLDYINCTETVFIRGMTCRKRKAAFSVAGKRDQLKVVQECYLKLEEMWKYNTGKCVDASPLLVVKSSGEFIVMIGSHSHRFSAICGSTGERLWETTLPDRIESSVCLSACGHFVVVGCYDGNVYCLHVDTGDILWQFETGSQVKCSPVVDTETGLVYIGSHSQTVYCLDVNAHRVVWKRHLQSGSIFSSPIISNDPHQLYIATLGGKMFALNPINGEVLWEYSFHKPVFSSPALTQQGVCVGCTDRCLYHLSFNGTLLWKYSTDGHIFSSPSVYKHTLSVSRNDGTHCVATDQTVDKSDKLHSGSIENNRNSDTISISEYVTFGSHDKCLYCVSSEGELIWKLQVDAEVYSSPFQCHISGDSHNISCDIPNDIYSKCLESQNIEGSVVENVIDTKENSEVGLKHDQPGNMSENALLDTSCNNYYTQELQSSESAENPFIRKWECTKSKILNKSESSKNGDLIQCQDNPALHVVVFASAVGTLYIIHAPTGNILCRRQLDGEIFSSPVIYNNTVIVGCRKDFVYCFKIS